MHTLLCVKCAQPLCTAAVPELPEGQRFVLEKVLAGLGMKGALTEVLRDPTAFASAFGMAHVECPPRG